MHLHQTAASRRIFARSAAALLTIIALTTAACDGGDDTPATPTRVNTPAPGETAAPTATPTEAPADPGLGATLEYEGELEAAIDVYAAVVAESDGDERQDARFRAAQLLSRTGRHDEARLTLEAFLADPGATDDASPARYMLASTLDDLADTEGALANYERYIAANGVLAPFARVERAKMLARLGRIAEAETAAEEALAGDLQPEFESSFLLSMGSAFEQAGADLSALGWYDRARSGGDVPSALARLGAVHKRLGDPAWVEEYRTVVVSYPDSGPAAELLDELDAASVATSDYTRGYVNYRAFRNTAAREAFDRAILAGDNAAQSLYYLAAIDERQSEVDSAIARYQQSYDLAPDSPLADDALWWRGRLLEIAGGYDEARATYGTLVARFTTSEFAADARFHGGMTLYRSGDLTGAAFAWGALASSASDDEGRARALFWQGRAETDAGNAEGERTLRRLVDEEPADFYALRAEVLLGDNDDDTDDADLDDDEIDWDDVAEYIEEVAGVTPVAATPVADDPRWRVVAELTTVGLTGQADTVYRSLVNDASEDGLAALYRTTRRMYEDGPTDWASRAATTLIADLPDDAPEPPDDLLRVAYPPAYGDLVESAAEGEDVPPLLLLALVRQESFYDPDAGSSAGALGLTQVIEPTGQSIADILGVTDWELTDLFRPKLSLRFGANYLASQLTSFEGNAYHALAAYNGGPGTALNAIESAGADVDLFAEDVEFEETRRYIRLVMEHYARYRQLYGDVGRPSLPQ